MRVARIFKKMVRFFRRPEIFDRTLVIALAVPPFIAVIIALRMGQSIVIAQLGTLHYLVTVGFLLMRRRRPILTAALICAVDAVFMVVQGLGISNIPTFFALYSLGRYTIGRTTAICAAALYIVYSVAMELATHVGLGAWLSALFVVGIAVVVGQLVRLRSELNERGRREAADAAVRAERRRIARELHDVVAHHITVINALVGGARATLPPEQEAGRNALESAEQTARQAMSEMRHLLDVLRADGNEGPDAATGVGADRLPALIEEARSAGLPASLTVTGEPVELPAAVDHAVYRIVQEALTNTRKHAVSARAGVRLAYAPDAVEVEVLDDGVAAAGGAAPGFGLGGMAERVALCGGQLSTGPRPEGGFRVHARIPLENA